MPNSAVIHIQKIAPGPPSAMAVATPARLPVPTWPGKRGGKRGERRNLARACALAAGEQALESAAQLDDGIEPQADHDPQADAQQDEGHRREGLTMRLRSGSPFHVPPQMKSETLVTGPIRLVQRPSVSLPCVAIPSCCPSKAASAMRA